MENNNKNISAEKIKNKIIEKIPSGTPYYTWRKDKGFVINGYIVEDKNG
jgi:hypothetical protein